jgi:hypothetical protein
MHTYIHTGEDRGHRTGPFCVCVCAILTRAEEADVKEGRRIGEASGTGSPRRAGRKKERQEKEGAQKERIKPLGCLWCSLGCLWRSLAMPLSFKFYCYV